jgi:translation initiation factor 1 (eIF-1/SUI1)
MSKNKPKPAAPAAALKHNPFASLSVERDALPAGEAPAPAVEDKPGPRPGSSRGRLVLRRETKHRGGKAVIIVRGFAALRGFSEADVEALAKELKQKLGCGGTVEQEAGETEIVLQGDRAAKVAELLRAQGFRVDGVTS